MGLLWLSTDRTSSSIRRRPAASGELGVTSKITLRLTQKKKPTLGFLENLIKHKSSPYLPEHKIGPTIGLRGIWWNSGMGVLFFSVAMKNLFTEVF